MQKIFFFAFLICVWCTGLVAQNDSVIRPQKNPRLCEIKMIDGATYKGQIQDQSDSVIHLKSSAGVIILIPKHNVAGIEFLNVKVTHDTTGKRGMQFHPIGIVSRYNVTSANAFLFNKGELYGSDSYFAFANVNYAVNRNFSIGISGTPIACPLGAIIRSNFELSPKLFLGFEGKISSLTYINPKTYGSEGLLKLTFGDDHTNITFFGGFFDYEDWVLPKRRRGRRGTPSTLTLGNYYMILNSPVGGVGFSTRVSQNAHFVADVSAYPNLAAYMISVGLRSCKKQKISWVFGFQAVKASVPPTNIIYNRINSGFIYPYIGFSYRL